MSDKLLSRLALLFACIVLVWHNLSLRPWMLDDGFIFFRYAENWAAGHGPVYNVGEAPVEGFTSFLWLALLTFGTVCGFDVVVFSIVLGHVIAFGTLVLVNQSWRWLRAVDVRTAAFATLFVGTCGAVTPWARSGMETGLHALVITALVVFCLRAAETGFRARTYVWLGVLCALAGMSRPDALLIVAVLAVDAMVTGRRSGMRGVVITASVFVALFGGYFAWRYWYFGYPFPNTFYAKVGATTSQVVRGLYYVGDAAITLAPLLLLPLLMGRRWRHVDKNYVVLPVLLVVYTAYIVAVGGDVMPAHRFFTPIVPAFCLVAAMALRALPPAVHLPIAAGSAVYGLAFVAFVITPSIRGDVVAFNGRISGLWLRGHAPKGSVIATNTAGSVVYYSGLRAIDTLGLNDLHIAHVVVPSMGSGYAGHEKGDGDYVLARRPEFIQLGSSIGWIETKFSPVAPFLGDRQLWANPEFHELYELLYRQGGTVWANGKPNGLFGFHVRKDVLARLKKGN